MNGVLFLLSLSVLINYIDRSNLAIAAELIKHEILISDLQLEDSDGLDMIELLKAMLPNTPMMLLTGVFFDPKVVRDPSCCASPTAPRTAAPTPTMRAWRCRRTANTW